MQDYLEEVLEVLDAQEHQYDDGEFPEEPDEWLDV